MKFVPDLPATPKAWQVCFMGMERRFWWDWLTPPGFRHVFLLGYVAEHGLWLCYDMMAFKTEITLLSGTRAGALLTMAHDQGQVLTWPAPIDPPRRFGLRLGFWCVPAIKHILGLRCVAMTPKGLHDYMLRRGARPLVEEPHEPVLAAED